MRVDASGDVRQASKVRAIRVRELRRHPRARDQHLGEATLTGATGTPINHADASYSNTTCPNGVAQSTDCWAP